MNTKCLTASEIHNSNKYKISKLKSVKIYRKQEIKNYNKMKKEVIKEIHYFYYLYRNPNVSDCIFLQTKYPKMVQRFLKGKGFIIDSWCGGWVNCIIIKRGV